MAAIAALTEVVGHDSRGRDPLVDLADREPPGPLPPPRLLGAVEPVLLGWTSRDPIVGRHAAAVVSGGVFRPFALVDGRAVATWRVVGSQVELVPLERLGRATRAALDRDGRDVLRFLGLSRS
jgi:hypothetical protein